MSGRGNGLEMRTGRRCTGAAIALVVALAWPAMAAAQQTVIVVRHAERADGGAAASGGSMTAPADPALSAAGEARALKLAQMLRDASVTAVYSTEFRRTADTGRPLAKARGFEVRQMPARDTAALVARLKAEHAKDVVLVIGHSNTVPDIIRALGGPAITMRDDEYDALYVLTPSTGTLTLIRY